MAANLMRRSLLVAFGALALAACASAPAPEPELPQADEAELVIFLVRHGEKEAGSDPALSPEGQARAETLAGMLAGEGVTEIWSTNTRRTRATAAPLAASTGLEVQAYDAATLPAFALWLRDTPGVKLVVGHSNTTDVLVGHLGGDPGAPIDDATEFDRLYVVSIAEDGSVSSRIERYGAPSPASGAPE